MKGKSFVFVFIALILGLFVIFLNTPTRTFFKPVTIGIASAEESNYRFSEAEEDMKEEEWIEVPEGVQEEGDEEQIYIPNTQEEEDFYKYAPYQSGEEFSGPDETEEEPGDSETRR